MFDLQKIQSELITEEVDGWLFYNFRNLDPSADSILDIPAETILTRRWFYLIPAQGEPLKLVHSIEKQALSHLPGKQLEYATWQQLHSHLQTMLASVKLICMQYSPKNAIPYVSFVDAGTLELVVANGVKVQSSATLVQKFEACWSKQGILSHQRAAQNLHRIVHAAFLHVKRCIGQGISLYEHQLQQFILDQFALMDMECDHAPIVAVNEHSGNPHYEPTPKYPQLIQKGDLLLIDLWAKEKSNNSIYADITWVAVVADTVLPEYNKIFTIVRQARDRALSFIDERLQAQQPVFGYEIDDVCRKVIEDAGYGKYFIHRTGHSIGEEVHWKGVNIDNYETRDERKLIDGIGFSIEPGIYLPEFGIRLEVDVYIDEGRAHVSGQPIQQELVPIFASNFPRTDNFSTTDSKSA